MQNRYLDNGAEIDGTSLWGGRIIKGDDGKYHIFIAGWDANSRAHSYWPNSDIYQLVADSPEGPYSNPVNIGKGHNPDIFVAADGSYVCYALIANAEAWRYRSSSLNGPWTFEQMPIDTRNRALSTGSTTTFSNWTFATRSDKSILCLDRGGAIWVSRDGLEPFEMIYHKSCYPNGGGGTFEDPVIWKDNLQYHMIVNDWSARIAYYSRSFDGYHWIHEAGTAYDPSVAVHPDGSAEEWYKFERPRVYQDDYGRAILLNMAVIDVEKSNDKAGDEHSSKNIAMPLNPGMLLEVLNTERISASTPSIRVKVAKETGFNPASDLDIPSLRFGSHSAVNTGGGASVADYETDSDGNLILTFSGAATGLTDDEFAPKLIGRYAAEYTNPATPTAPAGAMCFGYAKLPYIDYEPAYLSPVLPTIGKGSIPVEIQVKNFGLKASAESQLAILAENGDTLASAKINPVNQYETATVKLANAKRIPVGSKTITVVISADNTPATSHVLQLADATALSAKLSAAITEAENMLDNPSYLYGKDQLRGAVETAKSAAESFVTEELESALDALNLAVNKFKFANATASRPVSINLENARMDATAGWDILHEGAGADFHINNSCNKNYNNIGATNFIEAYNGNGITKPNYIQQTVAGIPAGRYVFFADVIAQKGSGGCDGVEIFIGDSIRTCSSAKANHSEEYSVEIITTEETDITVGLRVAESSNATWVAIDNARLLYYGDGSHDDDVIPANVTMKHYRIKSATNTANNIHLYADTNSGLLKRTNTLPDEEGIFTIITDEENNRVYMYNISTRSFVVPLGNSEPWEISQTNASTIGGPEPAETAGAFVIKGDPSSEAAQNFMNAHKGFNAADRDLIASYTAADKGSHWTLTETEGGNEFDVSEITSGKDEFIATLSLIPNVVITDTQLSVTSVTETAQQPARYFNLQGMQVASDTPGIIIAVSPQGKVSKRVNR